MKESIFTTVLPLDEKYQEYAVAVIHNTMTNALATLSQERLELYKKLLAGNSDNIPPEFLKQLTDSGFIVDDNLDEIKKFEYIHASSRFDSSTLSLTIAPSIDCQFGCPYCYEAGVDRSKAMDDETQTALINYIRQKNPRKIQVNWYGGEPLMQIDIIENLTKRILSFCKDNVIGYKAEMITNGYLLDENMLNRVLRCQIDKLQITIDGPREIHDNRRFLIGGGPTYDVIMQNIENAVGRIEIDLRVNIDKSNEDKLSELTNELVRRDILDGVHAYIGHVTCTEGYGIGNCISRKKYAELEDEWYDQLATYSKASKYTKYYHYPIQTTTRCMVETVSSFVVDPDGLLYKCWNHVGRKELSVGSIFDEELNISPLLLNHLMATDIYDQGCVKCNLLPYCCGGCLDEYLRLGLKRCHPRKYNYESYITSLAEEMLTDNAMQTA